MTSDPIERLRTFIRDNQDEPRAFTEHDDLIESGLIDSLRFVDFVLLVSELCGRDIPLDDIDIEAFRTLDAIRAAWFAPAAPEAVAS
ncbi:phosphopantetheine-binding protein [Salinarimonas rosea]|uniref:phosphopantetheine-binding protein n=1 Tax=Salinarimonas rosea TaxID=552063 RepID=UPI000413EFF1|nr:phosphopantetheine-binding protein [Salinarimonas rosea]